MGFLFDIVKPRIFNRLNKLEKRIVRMLEELQKQVKDMENATEAAIVLLEQLHAKLDACGTDAVKLQELKDELKASTEKLAEAVTANTPAE